LGDFPTGLPSILADLHGVSTPRPPIVSWFLDEFCGNFSSRFPMRALFHLEERLPAPVHDPVHSDIPELNGAELASVYYGRRMAGDFYDFIRVSPNRILFGLLDAAGGLAETRTVVAAAQHTFRTVGTELFARKDINEADAMMELCLQLNQAILKAAEGVCSCPAFAGCYDENLGIVCYFNAGHTPGLARDHNGVSELPATGLPLGLFSHMTSNASMVALEPGAVLLLASRGIVEGKCKAEEFGLERVKAVLHQAHASSAKELCVSVLDQVQQFMCAAPTHNDVTALALTRNS
jgi:serine phosphatase RsbU (regulator of sigma subunit)